MADTSSTTSSGDEGEEMNQRMEEEKNEETNDGKEDSSSGKSSGATTDSSDEDEEEVKEGDDEGEAQSRPTRGGSIFGSGIKGAKEQKIVPITISFDHLYYSVKESKGFFKQIKKRENPFAKQRKYILKDLHGTFYPNEVTAIIGPSGAGKTTLLNLFADRVQGGKVEGKVTINGVNRKKISTNKWRRLAAYVMQDDVMMANLTAKETLTFSSLLRVPGSFMHPRQCKERVENVITELGLQDCAKTRIGSPSARGISGGQRKRVSIGIELITEPSVLFLDEPTSGLDSSTAYSLVLTLRKLAEAGRTIITTIHQPSTDIFFKFDRVIVLSHGHMIYNGPSKSVTAYFSKLNYQCPTYTNPCEYALNLAKDDSYIASKEEGKERVQDLVRAYRSEEELPPWDFDLSDKENHHTLTSDSSPSGSVIARKLTRRKKNPDEPKSKSLLDTDIKPQKQANYLVQFIVLTIRSLLDSLREPMATYVRVFQTVILSLLVGFIYLQVGDGQASVQDREGALYFITVNMSMSSIFATIIVFPSTRLVFIREHATGSYSTLPFYLSKVSADLPFIIAFPILFSCIAYWMVGFDAEADKFFIFTAALISVANVAQSLGMALSAGVSDMGVAMALVPLLFVPLMLFGGFFLNTDNIPTWLIWVKYFSLFKYCFEIMALNEFDGLTFTCAESEKKGGHCQFETGKDVIRDLAMDNDQTNIWSGFCFLLMQYLLFRLIGYISLRFTAGRRKGLLSLCYSNMWCPTLRFIVIRCT